MNRFYLYYFKNTITPILFISVFIGLVIKSIDPSIIFANPNLIIYYTLIVAIIMLLSFPLTKAYINNYSIEIEDKAVIISKGIIFKKKISIAFGDIGEVIISRGLFEYLFKLKTIDIVFSGKNDWVKISNWFEFIWGSSLWPTDFKHGHKKFITIDGVTSNDAESIRTKIVNNKSQISTELQNNNNKLKK